MRRTLGRIRRGEIITAPFLNEVREAVEELQRSRLPVQLDAPRERDDEVPANALVLDETKRVEATYSVPILDPDDGETVVGTATFSYPTQIELDASDGRPQVWNLSPPTGS